MLITNPRASFAPYPAALQAVMSIARAEESRRWLSNWRELAPHGTPLYRLAAIARVLDVAEVCVKDESVRASLGSFKALGAPIALARLIVRLWHDRNLAPAALMAGGYADLLGGFTAISATDGNHGRALAAAARDFGCRCVIVLHANVSLEREDAIAAYGAEIVRIAGNYDESVQEAARLARANSWHVVSDTSYDGYEDIPRDVMQGYGTIAAEVVEHAGPFTHVMLQGGVGGMAAGVASYLWEYYGARRPRFVVVEPEQADCLYQSAREGRAARATGSVDSVMAGLACGETSPLAWRFLEPCIDHFMTIRDQDAVRAMQWLAEGTDDPPIVAGESGVAGLAALAALRGDAAMSREVRLDASSRVLLISTEGATAPSVYAQLVGESAQSVLARQGAWHERAAG